MKSGGSHPVAYFLGKEEEARVGEFSRGVGFNDQPFPTILHQVTGSPNPLAPVLTITGRPASHCLVRNGGSRIAHRGQRENVGRRIHVAEVQTG